MLSPETHPTLYPFSTAFWQTPTNPQLPHRTMIFSHPHPINPLLAKRHFPHRHHKNRVSSFTIDAILGLQEAETRHVERDGVDEAVCEFAIRRQLAPYGGGTKLPSRHRSLSAAHTTFLPASPYLAPSLEGGQTIGRFDSKGGVGRSQSGEKEEDFNFQFLQPFEAAGGDRKILGSDDNCTAVKKPVPPLGWPGDLTEHASKPKRVRTIFTQDQLDRLETEFARQQYMVGTERHYLAAQLGLTESQVKVWFQNRRIKWRKRNLECQQLKLAHYRALREKQRHGRHGEEPTESAIEPFNNNDVMNDDDEDVIEENKTGQDKGK